MIILERNEEEKIAHWDSELVEAGSPRPALKEPPYIYNKAVTGIITTRVIPACPPNVLVKLPPTLSNHGTMKNYICVSSRSIR